MPIEFKAKAARAALKNEDALSESATRSGGVHRRGSMGFLPFFNIFYWYLHVQILLSEAT